MLLVIPFLYLMGISFALTLAMLRPRSTRSARRLLILSFLIAGFALWLFGSAAWDFRDGFSVAPDGFYERSEGLEAFRRFFAEFWFGLSVFLAEVGAMAACWRRHQRRHGARS